MSIVNQIYKSKISEIESRIPVKLSLSSNEVPSDSQFISFNDTLNNQTSTITNDTVQKKAQTTSISTDYNSNDVIDSSIQRAADTYHLDPKLIKCVIKAESDFNPNAVSSTGAMGLMQLMPSTAKSLGVNDPFDPQQNIMGGSKYLASLIDQYNSIDLALAAYNAGPANVNKYGGIPPFTETQNYVSNILSDYRS